MASSFYNRAWVTIGSAPGWNAAVVVMEGQRPALRLSATDARRLARDLEEMADDIEARYAPKTTKTKEAVPCPRS